MSGTLVGPVTNFLSHAARMLSCSDLAWNWGIGTDLKVSHANKAELDGPWTIGSMSGSKEGDISVDERKL